MAFNCPLSPIKYRVHDGKINGRIVEHWLELLVAFLSRRPPLIEFYSRNVSVGSPFNRCVTAINHRVAEERPAGFKWRRQGGGFKRAFLSAQHRMACVSTEIKAWRKKRRFIRYQFIGLFTSVPVGLIIPDKSRQTCGIFSSLFAAFHKEFISGIMLDLI